MLTSPVLLAGVVAVLVVTAALVVLYSRLMPSESVGASLGLSAGIAAAGAATWVVVVGVGFSSLVNEFFWAVAALAGLAAFLATVGVRAVGGRALTVVAFGVLWSLLVFVPVGIATFVSAFAAVAARDYGGSLGVNVATGAATLGVLVAAGRAAPRLRAPRLPGGLGTAAVIALVLGWLAWLVAAELVLDEWSGLILVNGALGALGGIVGWLVVQRIRHQSTTLSGVAAGLLSGLVAVSAGAPLLAPGAAVASGVIAGGAACIFTLRRVGASRRQQWFAVGTHLIAGAVGLVLIGLLATDAGFLFTGQFGILQDQFISSVVVALYSALISAVLWLLLDRLPRRFGILR